MKLFKVDYSKVNYKEDCIHETYLTIGDSKEEVEERESEKLSFKLDYFMGCHVFEIDEVDGHKIIVD